MRFKCCYLNKLGVTSDQPPEYWREVHADSINEATKQAERYVRKPYILSTVKQDL